MKHDCPHCGACLKHRLIRSVPAPGERRILPMRAIPFCPECQGLLAQRPLKYESLLGLVIALPLGLLMEFRKELALRPEVFLSLIAGILCVGMVALGFHHWRYGRHAQRYQAYVPPHSQAG